jgi:hypothetical protein
VCSGGVVVGMKGMKHKSKKRERRRNAKLSRKEKVRTDNNTRQQ